MIGSVRSTAKTILGPRLIARARGLTIRNLPTAGEYRKELRGRTALEIGGPSEIFALGPLPVYSALRSVDGCNWASSTLWEPVGFAPTYRRQFIAEASSLDEVPDASYGCVLASHVLEHVANPLRALHEWRRVLTENGLVLVVLPNKDRTFDRRRPVTPVEHMVADYDNEVGEDDLTHLDEILELHDLSKDPPAGTPDEFRSRCLDNTSFRAIHHHVFTLASIGELLEHAGFTPIRSEIAEPVHQIVLARRA